MKKTEQIFKELAEKDFALTTNPKELTDEDYWSVLQQAMQETALQFYQWVERNENVKNISYGKHYYNGSEFTTAELFEIFNNEE